MSDVESIIAANIPPRAKEIDQLERYANGTQYDGLADFFDDDRSIWERAPCIVDSLVKTAVRSNVDLVLGEGRWPVLTSNPGEDDTLLDDAGFNEDESNVLDSFVTEIVRSARLKPAAKRALRSAQISKSSCTILYVGHDGLIHADAIKAKWTTPEFNRDGSVKSIVVQYPYKETYRDKDGQWKERAMLYRREVDATRDVTMVPVEARIDGLEPAWVEDPSKTVEHGFGFCPVIWYRFVADCESEGDIDGHAIHEEILDELRAHDYAVSMRHRSALFTGEPQVYEIGVEMGSSPSPEGRITSVPATKMGGVASSKNQVTSNYVARTKGLGRKKGPGQVWQYENPDTKVGMLSLPAGGLDAIDNHAKDLRQKNAEAMSVVLLTPDNVQFASTVSGKSLETLRERQLNACDTIRDDFYDGWLYPAVSMCLRICHAIASRGQKLRIRGFKKVSPLLSRCVEQVGQEMFWVGPYLEPKWGPYLKPDTNEEKAVVETTVAARQGGLITTSMALQKLRQVFPFDSEEQVENELEEERHEGERAFNAAMKDAPAIDDGEDAPPPPSKA